MVTLWGIFAGVAVLLAVVVTSLVIGVCLAVARITDAVQASRGRPQRRVSGRGGGRMAMPPAPGSGRRNPPDVPVAPRRRYY
jgi:hypothetical protein